MSKNEKIFYTMSHNYTKIKLVLAVLMVILLQWFLFFPLSGEDAEDQLIKVYFKNLISQTLTSANQEQNSIISISLLCSFLELLGGFAFFPLLSKTLQRLLLFRSLSLMTRQHKGL